MAVLSASVAGVFSCACHNISIGIYAGLPASAGCVCRDGDNVMAILEVSHVSKQFPGASGPFEKMCRLAGPSDQAKNGSCRE